MSVKKRFSIPAQLANGIRTTVKSAASHTGQLHYDMMTLDVIEPDPLNPRRLCITPADMRDPQLKERLTLQDERFRKEYEAIVELAESIKRIGVRNAIEVYKDGDKYRIISGERRFLASMIAGLNFIPARISAKPDEYQLRYMQWVENINREDLSLLDKYNNLVSIASAYKKQHQGDLTPQKLMEILNVSSSQTYRYYALLHAQADIIEFVKTGKLTNLKIVEELMAVKDPELRSQLIKQIDCSDDMTVTFGQFKQIQASKTPQLKKSSTSTTVKIPDKAVAKLLWQIILSHQSLQAYKQDITTIDWDSPKAINHAFKQVIHVLGKECPSIECE
jgi:ParB/RepB/Spo0J family partition protein